MDLGTYVLLLVLLDSLPPDMYDVVALPGSVLHVRVYGHNFLAFESN